MGNRNLQGLSIDELRHFAASSRDMARRRQAEGNGLSASYWMKESNEYRREIARRIAAAAPAPAEEG